MASPSQYTMAKHTILPLLYRIVCPGASICYLLKDPATKSLLMFNPWLHRDELTQQVPHSFLLDHIKNVERESNCRLTHVISNSSCKDYEAFKLLLDQQIPQVSHLLPSTSNNLKPQIVGELSVCFIAATGYTRDYHLIGVTHMTQSSSKLPVLFVDQMLGVCRIDYQHSEKLPEGTDADYLSSLDKIKYFPNESFIFPAHLAQSEDLLFARAVVSSDPTTSRAAMLMDEKIELFEKNHKKLPDCLIPTTVMEEKLMNPFLSPERYSKLLGAKDRVSSFGVLKSMRKQWRKD